MIRSIAEGSMTPFEDLVFTGIMSLKDGTPFFFGKKTTLDLSTIIIMHGFISSFLFSSFLFSIFDYLQGLIVLLFRG